MGFLFGVLAVSVGTPLRVEGAERPGATVEFNRDIRPIISDHCFACHGPDEKKRKADLRLDTEEGAFADLGGHRAIVPGDLEKSELYRRISTDDEIDRMPPKSAEKPLTAEQIELFRRWIEQGATWQKHWSFIPPKRAEPPEVERKDWPRNAIDRFIVARLEREGLAPSPEADQRTLIRRVTLDLTGLPPTPEEVDAFVADETPDAYEKVVDRLLKSPHYGERMAVQWLDLSRYADTHGYHIDSHRDMWRWREWVIRAFNENKPYDAFTVEQIAGDLLPNATVDQQLATGFNRNHMINFEGGAIPEEYQVAYIVDRVNTTSTVFMGLTMACAQCHDHKYDPFTQKDYYRFYAFFNNVPEQGLDGREGNAKPFIQAPLPDQKTQLEALRAEIGGLDGRMKELEPKLGAAQASWEAKTLESIPPPSAEGLLGHYELDGHAADTSGRYRHGVYREGTGAFEAGRIGQALKLDGKLHVDLGDAAAFERNDAFSYGCWVRPAGKEMMAVIARMDDADANRGFDLFLADGRAYVHLIHKWPENAIRGNTKEQPIAENAWHHVFVTYDGSSKAAGVKLYVDGTVQEVEVTHDALTETIRTTKPLLIGRRSPGAPFKGLIDEVRVYDRLLSPAEVEVLGKRYPFRAMLALAAAYRTDEQRNALRERYLKQAAPAEFKQPYEKLLALREQKKSLVEQVPTSMVMQEMAEPRETFMLVRGNYANKGEPVSMGVPAVLPPLAGDAPQNRLGLARWLVSDEHPLTARVAVNRYWQMYFGTGLVKTAEDFGSQGEWPTHPELLDWLARAFIESGWDVKALQKLIVTSATYRQSARLTPELRERDPENRLYARGPRFRLQAEFIRDGALAVSGLLTPKIGGPSVKPYQPPGLWEAIAYGERFTAQRYEQDHGDKLYRRSMYTFWKRTLPPASLATFDAPDREFCVARRSRTNTPLQALVLMNDPTYVEAARFFGQKIIRQGGDTLRDRIVYAFRWAVARPPSDAEIAVIEKVYRRQRERFAVDITAAMALITQGESNAADDVNVVDLAAWTAVANMILNLDETITRG